MKKALFGLAALAAASLCHAAPYAVFSFGAAHQSGACEDGDVNCDDTSTGLKLLGGYGFTPNWAVEGGYFNFGKSKFDDGTVNATAKVDGFGVGGAYHYDFTPEITGVARLGIASMKVKLDAQSTGISLSSSESHTQPYWGLGVDYKLAPNWSVGASYDGAKVKASGERSNVSLLGVGVTMSF